MSKRTVLLYGQSLLLTLVASSLEESGDLAVTRAATWTEASELLVEGMPDVLVFDLIDACESHVVPLLLKKPQLVLVGLDTERNQALLLGGHDVHSLTMDGLREIVKRGSL